MPDITMTGLRKRWTDSLDFAFANIDKACDAWRKQKPHDPSAPYDAYDESDDTEERAKK